MRKNIFVFVWLMFSIPYTNAALFEKEKSVSENSTSSLFVTAYYPYWALWNMPPSAVDYSAITHLIVFSYDPDSTKAPYFSGITQPQDSIDWHIYGTEDSLIAMCKRNNVKALMCIGGIWGNGAAHMYAINSDSVKAQIYVDALLGYAKRHNYDGIDVDWEFPPNTSEGRTRFMRLMRLLRRGLDNWNPRGILVAAVPAWTTNMSYNIPELNTLLDQYNIMSYDYSGGAQAWFNAGLRSNTYLYPGTSSWWTWDSHGAKQWIARGADPKRLAMGIPFYSWRFTNAVAPTQTIGSRRYGSYSDAVSAIAAQPSGYRWDDSAKAPWWGSSTAHNGSNYITFDDTNSVKYKVQWCKDVGIGGVMIYELWSGWLPNAPPGQRDPLLQAVKKAVGP